MSYRVTAKAKAQKEKFRRMAEASHDARRANAMARPAPVRPWVPPHNNRCTITIVTRDTGVDVTRTFDLMEADRIDRYDVLVDGKRWKVCGITGVCEGIRKALPRVQR